MNTTATIALAAVYIAITLSIAGVSIAFVMTDHEWIVFSVFLLWVFVLTTVKFKDGSIS